MAKKKDLSCTASVFHSKTIIIQGKNTLKKKEKFMAQIKKELDKIETNRIIGKCEIAAMTFS